MNEPLVIDLDDVRGEVEEMPLCRHCESRHCLVVEPDGTWAVSLSHDARCSEMRQRFTSIPGGAA